MFQLDKKIRLRKNSKGFTLAELLIVVAIIGVLVAIGIPIFNSQLEKARRTVDLDHARIIGSALAGAMNSGDLVIPPGHDYQLGIQLKKAGTKKSVDGWVSPSDAGSNITLCGVIYQGQGSDHGYQMVVNYLKKNYNLDFDAMYCKQSKKDWYTVSISSDGTLRYGDGTGKVNIGKLVPIADAASQE